MYQAEKIIRAVAVALVVAGSAVMAAPSDTEASGTGPWAPATVRCDDFTNQLVLTPIAGAMPGYNSQEVYFRYWVYNASTRTYLWSGQPTAWGSLVHTAVSSVNVNPFVPGGGGTMREPGPIAGPTLTLNSLAAGDYQVYTQYAWYNGGWDLAGGWSNRFQWAYQQGFFSANSCRI